ncbi:MAG: hypothetical protein ACR2H2_05675 [Solirubrobacteraceae bacterium]
MSPGNFSNGGVDTFDERKRYVGVRLQQGVPLLDRDWNELEDIRRHFERRLRELNIGAGVPDLHGFEIKPPGFAAQHDVLISAGSCSVGGLDVVNERDVLFSEQGDREALPPPADAKSGPLTLYLEPEVVRIDATVDAALKNAQDINMETCLRDQLRWTVRAVRRPALPPPGACVLAEINRGPGQTQITADMIVDRRRTMLNLADAVDRLGSAERRLTALEQGLQRAQLEIETLRESLNKLFWEVRVEHSNRDLKFQALFGSRATINVSVTDRNGDAINGAMLDFSTDWGYLTSRVASTDARGRASVELIGVKRDFTVDLGHTGVLQRASQKVAAARLGDPGAIEYAKVRLDPEELALVSRYSPASELHDLSSDLPPRPIIAPPQLQIATVTVHVRDSQGAIVRGVGSVQVRFGLWVRDWAQTKIVDVTKQVTVAARIGDLMRQGFDGEGSFDHGRVSAKLPHTLQAIHEATQTKLKENMFGDPGLSDSDILGSGLLGQVIAQETTAAVGAGANNAITTQLAQFVAAPELPLQAQQATIAQTEIVQRSSQIAAGFAQSHKQMYSVARMFG